MVTAVKLRSRVHRAEAAAVQRHRAACDEAQVATKQDEPSADRLNGRTLVAAEVGDGLDVGCQLARQPHDLDVAACLALQPAARLDQVEIAVDVELEHCCRVIARPPRRSRILKAQRCQIQLVDKHIDEAHSTICGHVIVHARRQEKLLAPVTSLDKTTHSTSPRDVTDRITSGTSHTASTNSGHFGLRSVRFTAR